MLVLSRRESESILIGDDVAITVVRIEPGKVRLGITAPRSVNIAREELMQAPHPAEAACDVEDEADADADLGGEGGGCK